MIILEGPDGCGKSTLGRELSSLLSIPYSHTSKPARTLVEMDNVLTQMMVTRSNHVYDRVPVISERIYGPLLRGHCKYEDDHWRYQMTRLLACRPMFVYCRPKIETILSNEVAEKAHKPPEHVQKVRERLLSIIHCYDDFFIQFMCIYPNVLVYNWDNAEGIKAALHRFHQGSK